MKETMVVITPSDFTDEPIELSQEAIEKYEQYASEKLASFIDTIQLGLSFLGIKANINENQKNRIDFYDCNNNLLHSDIIEAPKNKTEYIACLSNTQFSSKFKTNLGEVFWKGEPINEGKNSENYYFYLDCGDYSRDIFVARRNGKISSIEAKIYGQKDFNTKELEINNIKGQWLKFYLDDVFGPKGKHEDGKARCLRYSKSIFNSDISACMYEKYGNKKYTSIDSSHTSWDGNERDRITIWENDRVNTFEVSDIKVLDYISGILSYPRSKEIISYMEKEIEREFPGMMNFIKTNFEIYNQITGLNYDNDQEFKELYNGVILPECDFTNEESKNILARR